MLIIKLELRPGTIIRSPVVLGPILPNGNLKVWFDCRGYFGMYPYCEEGISPQRVPEQLRRDGQNVFFVYNHLEELIGIEPRELTRVIKEP